MIKINPRSIAHIANIADGNKLTFSAVKMTHDDATIVMEVTNGKVALQLLLPLDGQYEGDALIPAKSLRAGIKMAGKELLEVGDGVMGAGINGSSRSMSFEDVGVAFPDFRHVFPTTAPIASFHLSISQMRDVLKSVEGVAEDAIQLMFYGRNKPVGFVAKGPNGQASGVIGPLTTKGDGQ